MPREPASTAWVTSKGALVPINIKIEGDPESIRSAATWLRATFSSAVYESVTQIYHARGNSESFWEGEAGGGFRTKMTAAGRNGDAMADGADQAGQAFEGYAGDLQTGQIGMERARRIALDGGLDVSGDEILDPGPAPTAPAGLPADATPQMVQSHNDAVAAQQAHAQKVAAYAAAGEEAERARKIVADSIREFGRRITQGGHREEVVHRLGRGERCGRGCCASARAEPVQQG